MSLSSLVSTETQTQSKPVWGLPGWVLPAGLVLGFLIIFGLLFGERLLPKVEVRTSQVVTLRGNASSTASSPTSRQLLFQASGWLEPDPYSIQVPALVNGVVEEVHVLEGQSVKKGDLLATLVDDEARLNLQKAERNLDTIRANIAAHCSLVPEINARLVSAKAKVEAEKARLAELKDTANRLKALPEGAASLSETNIAIMQANRQEAFVAEAESEIPRLEAELATIDFQRIAMGNGFSEAESARDLAQLAFDRHRITAPTDGRVLELYAQPGKKRMLDMDDPTSALIVELYQPTQMQARIDVPLNEASGLAVGQEVELTTDLLNDITLTGTVTRITGEADLARNTLQAKVAIANPDDRLRPEMLVRAKFYPLVKDAGETEEAPSSGERLVLMAPSEALFEVSGQQAKAWVATTEATAELRSLTLGNSEKDGFREVRDGLRSGEQLILPPFNKLDEGARLSIISNNF
ncbi:efflux RND transporter periplasmic adaptor subunit [Roseibacillus persicicus]|uniref:efflux RND transporter periplasmic adaptor subunit n=1 Tax=Roseibacillus persicicus TaxID=454148 RepID=UPI00398B54FC